ncbi:MAG: hypothetical protein ACXWL2_02565 [Candidatus Chromulinivorax sp.]
MLQDFFKHLSVESQGIFAFILGLILILGTLGKLQVLQGILNSLMIITGLILLIWGFKQAKGMQRVQKLLQSKK